MDVIKRKLLLDVCDYTKKKLCPLYDSMSDVSGQASNVIVTSERNGSKLLTFQIPTTCKTDKGDLENYRLQYLKGDYLIRLLDLKLTDWFLLTQPKVSHRAYSKNITVKATHISQLLKYKNLLLLFSESGLKDNVGTAYQLVSVILLGTGWQTGTIANFYLDNTYNYGQLITGKSVKMRSITASTKTGAFKLIATVCDKFNAKPVYHGDTKKVDILPMNPFLQKDKTKRPDVSNADGVMLLHYGKNIKAILKQINTLNIATRLYVYGNWSDKDLGYISIGTCYHQLFNFTNLEALVAGEYYSFSVTDPDGYTWNKIFKATINAPAGRTLIYSFLDPASMMYVWDEQDKKAFPIKVLKLIFNIDIETLPWINYDGWRKVGTLDTFVLDYHILANTYEREKTTKLGHLVLGDNLLESREV